MTGRVVFACVALTVALGAPAEAHRRGPLHNAQHLAALVFGPNVCGDTMRVPIVKRDLGTGEDMLGLALWDGQLQAPPTALRTGCEVVVDNWLWSDETCTVVLHEFGHLAGWDHGTDPNAPPGAIEWLMWPRLRGPWQGCSSARLLRYAAARAG